MKMSEYLSIPAVSAGLLRELLDRCPRAAWFQSWLNPNPPEPDDTAITDAGTVAHSILLEGNTDGVCVIDPFDHPTPKTDNIPTGFTNKSIRAARDEARAAGLIPILKPAMAEINTMVASAQSFIASLKDTEPAIWAAFQPNGGASEQTFTWKDGPTQCKIRPDRISSDRKLIIDPKFTGTSAEPDKWGRTQMIGAGYYLSAAFYRRGINALFGVEPDYVFLVVETEPPYLCSLVGCDPHALELGAAKIEAALLTWAECARDNQWPGFPSRVCYPEIPGWVQASWDEKEAMKLWTQP